MLGMFENNVFLSRAWNKTVGTVRGSMYTNNIQQYRSYEDLNRKRNYYLPGRTLCSKEKINLPTSIPNLEEEQRDSELKILSVTIPKAELHT